MNKTKKRMFTAALALTMTAVMLAVPAAAEDYVDGIYVGDAALVKSVTLMHDKSADMQAGSAVLKTDTAYTGAAAWGVDDAKDIGDGFLNSDGYLWGAMRSSANTVSSTRTIAKKFTPVQNGETLKLSTRFKLGWAEESGEYYTAYGLQLRGDGGEKLALLDQKVNAFYSYVHLLSGTVTEHLGDQDAHVESGVITNGWVFENGEKTTINAANNVFSNDSSKGVPVFNIQAKQEGGYARPFDGELTLTLTAAPNAADAAKYDLKQTISGVNISLTSSKTVDAAVVTALNSFHIMQGNYAAGTAKLIGVRDVYAAQLNTSGNRTLAQINPANVTVSDIVTGSDEGYQSGAKLGSVNLDDSGNISAADADLTKINDEFKVEDGYLWAYVHNQESVTTDRAVAKHFSPVQDGETLKLSATVRFNYVAATDNYWLGSGIELTGTGGSLPLIQYGINPYWRSLRFLNNGGGAAGFISNGDENADVVTVGNKDGKLGHQFGFGWQEVEGNDLFKDNAQKPKYMYLYANHPGETCSNGGDITLNLTAKPNESDSSKYDLIMTTVGPNIDVTSARTVDAALITGMTDICMVSTRTTTPFEITNPEKLIGIKNLSVTAGAAEGSVSAALKEGSNTVYIPVRLPDGNTADFAVVAAVCDKATGVQKNFFIKEVKGKDNNDDIAMEVDITAPQSEYVTIYVFDSFTRLAPYAVQSQIGM